MIFKYNRNKNKTHLPRFLRFLAAVFLLGGVSFAAAWTWQSLQETQGQAVPTSPDSVAAPREEPGGARPDPEPAATLQEDLSLNSAPPGEEPADQEQEDRAQFSDKVPPSKRVDNSYFRDAIFLGDTATAGMALYKVAPNLTVVAAPGVTPDQAAADPVISTPEGGRTMLEAAQRYGEKQKVYIMLGGNGLEQEKNEFISGYREFVRLAKTQYPEAVIYLQSILPVTRRASEQHAYADNQRITEYNLAIMALATEQGAYYLDVAAALVNGDGELPVERSPLDGVHLSAECYAEWMEYLRTHTAG